MFVKSNITLAEDIKDKIEELGEGIEEAAMKADSDNSSLRLYSQVNYINYFAKPDFYDDDEPSVISSTSTAASSKSSKPKKPYYKPTQNGGKKANGEWDARTKIGREAIAREKEQAANKAQAEEKKVDLAGYDGKLRKDGLPDKRTKDGKDWHNAHNIA